MFQVKGCPHCIDRLNVYYVMSNVSSLSCDFTMTVWAEHVNARTTPRIIDLSLNVCGLL